MIVRPFAVRLHHGHTNVTQSRGMATQMQLDVILVRNRITTRAL